MSQQYRPFRGPRGHRGGRGRGGCARSENRDNFHQPSGQGSGLLPTPPDFLTMNPGMVHTNPDVRGMPPRNAYHTSSLNSLDGSGREKTSQRGATRGKGRGGQMSRGPSVSDLSGSNSNINRTNPRSCDKASPKLDLPKQTDSRSKGFKEDTKIDKDNNQRNQSKESKNQNDDDKRKGQPDIDNSKKSAQSRDERNQHRGGSRNRRGRGQACDKNTSQHDGRNRHPSAGEEREQMFDNTRRLSAPNQHSIRGRPPGQNQSGFPPQFVPEHVIRGRPPGQNQSGYRPQCVPEHVIRGRPPGQNQSGYRPQFVPEHVIRGRPPGQNQSGYRPQFVPEHVIRGRPPGQNQSGYRPQFVPEHVTRGRPPGQNQSGYRPQFVPEHVMRGRPPGPRLRNFPLPTGIPGGHRFPSGPNPGFMPIDNGPIRGLENFYGSDRRGSVRRGRSRGRNRRGRAGDQAERKQVNEQQDTDSDDSDSTIISDVSTGKDDVQKPDTSTVRNARNRRYWRRGSHRGGRWSSYSNRYNKHVQEVKDKNADVDFEDSQSETASVRSSSPMSVTSELLEEKDIADVDVRKQRISIEDIEKVSATTLNNRVKRYQKKIITLKCLDMVDQDEINHINDVVSKIKEELAKRRQEARKIENKDSIEIIETETVNEEPGNDDSRVVTKPIKFSQSSKRIHTKVMAKKGGVTFKPISKVASKLSKETKNSATSGKCFTEDQVHLTSDSVKVNDEDIEKNEPDSTNKQTEVKGRRRNRRKVKKEEPEEETDEQLKDIENLLGGLDAMFLKDKCPKQTKSNEVKDRSGKGHSGSQTHGESPANSNEMSNKKSVKPTPVESLATDKETPNKKHVKHTPSADAARDGEAKDARERRNSGNQQNEPNVNEVFKFMVKEMDGRGSVQDIAEKCDLFPQDYDKDFLERWFKRNAGRFTLISRDGHLQYVLVLKKECKSCLDYVTIRGCSKNDCNFYHVCRDFLSGFCRYTSSKCRFSHDLFDDYNLRLSKEMGYSRVFNTTELCAVLRARYPHVCASWNKGDCCNLNCMKLHLCKRFVQGECLEGADCILSHDRYTDHNKPIVDAYFLGHWNEGLFRKMIIVEKEAPQEVVQTAVKDQRAARPKILPSSRANRVFDPKNNRSRERRYSNESENRTERMIPREAADRYEDVHISPPPPSPPQPSPPQPQPPYQEIVTEDGSTNGTAICDLDLVGKCNKQECGLIHNSTKLPYIWQVELFGSWITLADAEDKIERPYCTQKFQSDEVLVTSHQQLASVVLFFEDSLIEGSIRFDGYENFQSIGARRISTMSYSESSKDSDKGDSYKTQWRWYWKDDADRWQLYEEMMQYTLESKYLAGQKEYLFSRDNYRFKYVISFDSMTQINLDTYTTRVLIRRPLLVKVIDVCSGILPPRLRPVPPIEVALPEGWVPWDNSNEFELVKLTKSSREYKHCARKFFTTISEIEEEIECIYRVQSHAHWSAFCNKEKIMKAVLERTKPGAVLDKRELFHGTRDLDSVRGICTHNFDQRVSGKHGTVHGDGTYFARDAKYSHSYTAPPERYVFLAQVLVGQFTKGSSEYRRPPALPGSKLDLYDSCVDNIHTPSLFVIFDKSQHYPAYLIKYSDKNRGTSASARYSARASSSYVSPPIVTSPARSASTQQSQATPVFTSRSNPRSSLSRPTITSPKKDTSCCIQ